MARIYRRYKNGKLLATWWCAYKVPGNPKPVRESTRTADETAAKRFLEGRIRETGMCRVVGPMAERTKWADLERLIRDDYRLKGRRSARDLENSLRHLRAVFEHYKAPQITSLAIAHYAADRLGAGAAPGSVNRELAALKRTLRLALKHGAVGTVPYIEMLPENNARQAVFTYAEFAALRDAMPAEAHRDFLAALYHTGVRRTQMALLEWRDIFAEHALMRGETTKNGEAHKLPLRGEFGAVIARARERRRLDCRFVFHCDGQPLVYGEGSLHPNFRQAWEAALKAAGLEGRWLHDLRRSAATNLARAGVPEQVAMRITGHKSMGMYRRYNIVDEDSVAAALERQEQYVGELAAKISG